MDGIQIFFDGGYRYRGDPHRVRWGFVAYNKVGMVLHKDGGKEPCSKGSSTVAEFIALEKAISWAVLYYSSTKVTFYGDAADVIKAMRREGIVGNKFVRKIYQRVLGLTVHCKYWTFEWVPREQNAVANWLTCVGAKGALTASAPSSSFRA